MCNKKKICISLSFKILLKLYSSLFQTRHCACPLHTNQLRVRDAGKLPVIKEKAICTLIDSDVEISRKLGPICSTSVYLLSPFSSKKRHIKRFSHSFIDEQLISLRIITFGDEVIRQLMKKIKRKNFFTTFFNF